MKRLRTLERETHLRDPAIKQRYVTAVFEAVAGTYDRFTRAFSFGMDARWKREMLAALLASLEPGGVVLDAACGTADLALAAARLTSVGGVVALDPSRKMLAAARRRCRLTDTSTVHLGLGDLVHLPVRSESIDGLIVGYGFRNVADVDAALAEARHVLRPGGLLISLDFFRPLNPLWRVLFLGYLRLAGAAVGWLWHREPATYGYIAPSIAHFVSADTFSAFLRRHGFTVETVRRKLHGGIAIHVARRD